MYTVLHIFQNYDCQYEGLLFQTYYSILVHCSYPGSVSLLRW